MAKKKQVSISSSDEEVEVVTTKVDSDSDSDCSNDNVKVNVDINDDSDSDDEGTKKKVVAPESDDSDSDDERTKKEVVVPESDDSDSGDEKVVVPEKKEKKKAVPKKKSPAAKKNTNSDKEGSDGDVAKRHVMTPIERIDLVMKKMEESGTANTKEIMNQMMRLRKQLDGAKIKQATTTRAPNAYNLWMKDKMALLKGNDMNPKERFSECIRLWNENKKKIAESVAEDDK